MRRIVRSLRARARRVFEAPWSGRCTRWCCVLGALLGATIAAAGVAPAAERPPALRIVVAASLVETGLLDDLAREFEARHPGVPIEIRSHGALAVLEEARRGHADLIVTHHPPSEKMFVAEGYGLLHTEILYDQFALFGPAKDQLGLARQGDFAKVIRTLAEKEVSFLAPAPQSGTYKKLMELFDLAGVTPGWIGFENTGTSAAATLQQAAQFGAYTLLDMGNYLANRDTVGQQIVPLFRDHPALRNTYSAIVVSAARVPGAQQEQAELFLDYLVSEEAQALIGRYGDRKFGVPLFTPVAHLDEGLKARRAAADLGRKMRIIYALVLFAAALAAAGGAATVQMRRARRAEGARRVSEERFALAVGGTHDGIWDWDIRAGTAYFSPRWKELLGYRADEPLEDSIETWRSRIHPDDRERVLALLDDYLKGHGEQFAVEHRMLAKDGDAVWAQMRGKALWAPAPEGAGTRVALRMSGSMTDITERKLQEAALARMALHDVLTGLPNRTLLYERLNQAIMSARRDNGPVAVAMLDLENFTKINEAFGHPSGDLILQQVAARLAHDRPETHTVARSGGDSFFLILPDKGALLLPRLAHDIARALEPPFELGGQSVPIQASLGFAFFPEHGEDPVILVQHAEMALYRARQQSSGYAVYDLDPSQGSQRYSAFDAELRQAVERDELLLHYQPIMNLRTGFVSGVEALVRWRHPQHGLLGPEAFIPRAEHMGLVGIPALWVLEQTASRVAAWRRQGRPLTAAVNLSAGSLHDRRLPERIAALLDKTGIPPESLELEITESAVTSDPARAAEILGRLHAMKLTLVIDDFGAGYASLSCLKQLPVDKIKLDRLFVANMMRDDGDAEIVRATVLLARRLGLKVMAEGVESEEMLKALALLGCDQAQGPCICQPLAEGELLRWLANAGWEDTDARQGATS